MMLTTTMVDQQSTTTKAQATITNNQQQATTQPFNHQRWLRKDAPNVSRTLPAPFSDPLLASPDLGPIVPLWNLDRSELDTSSSSQSALSTPLLHRSFNSDAEMLVVGRCCCCWLLSNAIFHLMLPYTSNNKKCQKAE